MTRPVTAVRTVGDTAAPARWLARFGMAVRTHWLAALFFSLGAGLRLLAQFSYRPALFYIDSVKYLYTSDGNDPEGYKLPLRAILAVANFDAVIAVQHLLGLAVAAGIYLLLLRRGVSRWLAALAIAPVLLDAYQLQQEQSVMPTVWFEALVVAAAMVLLWQPEPGWRRVLAGGLVVGASATVWQAGEALIPAAAIFMIVAGGGWRRALGKAVVLVAGAALPILAYCTGSYLLTGNFFLSHQGVTSLYGRTAAAVDCATITLTPAQRHICPSAAQQARGDNWLEFGTYAPVQSDYRNLPGSVDSLITSFNDQVLRQQPLRVAGAYLRDVGKLFALTRDTAPGDPPISRWQFQASFPYFDNHATPAIVDGAVRRFGGGLPAVWRPGATALRAYQLHGGFTPGPLLALAAVTGLAGSLAALRRRLDPQTRQLALACLLFFASGACVLLVADLFVFSWRYQLEALVTLVPAGALGITVITRLVLARRTTWLRRPAGAGQPATGSQTGRRAVASRSGNSGPTVR